MNIDFDHLPKDELLLDLKQYRQELVCAFTVIKSNHLEGEYLAAVKSVVKDLDLKQHILNSIVTDKHTVLGTKLADYNDTTQKFILKNLSTFIAKQSSKEQLCLKKEIKQLKDENKKLKNSLRQIRK